MKNMLLYGNNVDHILNIIRVWYRWASGGKLRFTHLLYLST